MIFNSKRRGKERESDIILSLQDKVHGEPSATMSAVGRQNENRRLKMWFDFRHTKSVISCSTVRKCEVRISKRCIIKNMN